MATQQNNIEVVVVVSGQPTRIRVNVHQKVGHLIQEALKRSGNQGQGPSEWELRREDGSLVEPELRIDEAGIAQGATLFLNPKAGAGGER